MLVAIAGGHGQIARRMTRLLVGHGDRVRGLIRNPGHAEDVRADGAEPVICDIEHGGVAEIARAISGADAVVFAAGAGPGSGPQRKWTIDRDGAIKLCEAASGARVDRYLMISSIGAEHPPDGDDTFSVYLRAKAQADEALMASDREWTIVRPGRLTDDPGAGRVRVDPQPFREHVPRDDVAAVLNAVLHEPRSVRRVLYVGSGEDEIDAALAKVLGRTDAGAPVMAGDRRPAMTAESNAR
jgi:uncharacterized protein YbjT (DUF2867 family)